MFGDGDPYTPDDMPPQPPRRKRHVLRYTAIGAGAIGVGAIVAAAIAGGGHPKPAPSTAPTTAPAVAATTSAPAAPPSQVVLPPPSPSANPVTKVTFTVSGWGNPSITYGTDSDNRDGGGQLGQLGDGNGLPWHRSITFDSTAQYYFINAQLEGAGAISCKIVATGPGDNPLTVSSGHASGGYNICSAQAAPQDAQGLSWSNEE